MIRNLVPSTRVEKANSAANELFELTTDSHRIANRREVRRSLDAVSKKSEGELHRELSFLRSVLTEDDSEDGHSAACIGIVAKVLQQLDSLADWSPELQTALANLIVASRNLGHIQENQHFKGVAASASVVPLIKMALLKALQDRPKLAGQDWVAYQKSPEFQHALMQTFKAKSRRPRYVEDDPEKASKTGKKRGDLVGRDSMKKAFDQLVLDGELPKPVVMRKSRQFSR